MYNSVLASGKMAVCPLCIKVQPHPDVHWQQPIAGPSSNFHSSAAGKTSCQLNQLFM